MTRKVGLFDRRVYKKSQPLMAVLGTTFTYVLMFYSIPDDYKRIAAVVFALALIVIYLGCFVWANALKNIKITIEGSAVRIVTGDIFKQDGLRVIAFNNYFDTLVDNKLIARSSINGQFIESHAGNVAALDTHIATYGFDQDEMVSANVKRARGKKVEFLPGTICVYGDYLLTAFAKFDEHNQAVLTMPEYLGFLIRFWDSINRVYAQRSVSTTIFGSGMTRIKNHKNISDEDLLKIMLWTFRISEMRFTHPAKLTIVVHKEKIDQINLLDIASAKNGV